jgi:hypothetical protein
LFPLYLTFKQLAHDPTSPKQESMRRRRRRRRRRKGQGKGEEIKLSV